MIGHSYISLILKVFGLGMVVSAGSFWAAAGVDSRPKYKDEQTLVGGTVWSQIIIPIGLMISMIAGEEIDTFTHAYFLFCGIVLLASTGIFLIIRECLVMTRHRRFVVENAALSDKIISADLVYDKIYFVIGLFCLIASLLSLADFFIVIL